MRKYIATLAYGVLATGAALAANSVQVGTVVIDPPTLCCLGFSVPIVGDDNYNAQAQVAYRTAGAATWQTALPLLRVRPDTLSTEDPPSGYALPDPTPQFAGSIFGLLEDTNYEVRISVTDPDGGNREQILNVRTRAAPRTLPATPRMVQVANRTQLDAALAGAQAGDVITLAAGTYTGSVTISRSGTATNPIVVRGASLASTIVDATGAAYGVRVTGDHVYLENLTVRNSDWGALASDSTGIVIRRNRFTNVNKGIDARAGSNTNLYICDNMLEGKFTWPNVSSATWDEEGIAVGGQGIVVCFNTLSGFGDALGMSHLTDIPNIAIDFYGNDVLWTGDDGMEIDFAHRNVRAFGNRITNSGMGVSLQPVWGGPVYIVRNVLVNQASSPYKLNNEPTGFYILNNTSIRTNGGGNYAGYALPQIGYQLPGHWSYVANFQLKNNILIGASGPARITSTLTLADIDYNGWSPDGAFTFYDVWNSLSAVKASSPYEAHGVILSAQPFQTTLTLPPDYTTRWTNPDVTLRTGANAIDAGLLLPNITDGFSGAAPDLGALELGSSMPAYGVRPIVDTVPPSPPSGVQVQ